MSQTKSIIVRADWKKRLARGLARKAYLIIAAALILIALATGTIGITTRGTAVIDPAH